MQSERVQQSILYLLHIKYNKGQQKMMLAKKFIYHFDMFAAVPGFRVRGQSEVASVCGGLASIILLLLFVYIFMEDSLKILNFQKIEASLTTKRDRSDDDKVTDVMFAIGLEDFTFKQMTAYLTFSAYRAVRNDKDYEYEYIQLVRCTKDMWSDLGNQTDTYFENYEIGDMLCPSENSSLLLQGIDSSDIQNELYISVEQCDNSTQYCADFGDIMTRITQYIAQNQYIIASFLYLNTGFNVNNKEPVSRFIDSSVWLTFTAFRGTEAFVEIGTYEIKSDVSVLPWYEEEVLTGTYIANYKTASFQIALLAYPIYVQLFITLSPESKEFQRKYGKLDDSLAYVGGLFGIIIGFLAFFIASYNQYRYELFVGEGIFSLKNGTKMTQQDFHFGTYVIYSIYDWIKVLCCCCCDPQWETCKKLEETRDEANEQIDVRYLMRRISHLQQMNKLRYSKSEDVIMLLSQVQTIDSVRYKRRVIQYYDTVMEGKKKITINTLNTAKDILQLGALGNLNFQQSLSFLPEAKKTEQMETIEEYDLDIALQKQQTYLAEENEKVELDEDMLQIERQISELFHTLPAKSAQEMVKNIPLLVLYRLKKLYKQEFKALEGFKKFPNSTKVIQIQPN